LSDEILRAKGFLEQEPRHVEVEALIDPGATRLCLKPSVIRALGLEPVRRISSRTANGTVERTKFTPVRLELMGRTESFDVVELSEDVPNLVGQVPLEVLDFVIDPGTQRLIANPEHGGIQMDEQYCAHY
jgi:predicted aspartyl protease